MLSLGYNEYVCQDGDWGSIVSVTLSPQQRSPLTWARRSAVSSPLSTAVRQSRRGTRTCPGAFRSLIFTTSAHCFARGGPPSFKKAPLSALQHALTPYSSAEKAGLARREDFATWGWGYRHEQATRPQTLGYGLADSPVGLLAWIYEKLVQ
jgi:hypothetical protein